MKTLILAISIFVVGSAIAADDKTPGLGPKPGDSCYCVTCPSHNKCGMTLYDEPREQNPQKRDVQSKTGPAKKGRAVKVDGSY
jgi:hypothetical protein